MPGHFYLFHKGDGKLYFFSLEDRIYFHHALWPFIYLRKTQAPPPHLVAPLRRFYFQEKKFRFLVAMQIKYHVHGNVVVVANNGGVDSSTDKLTLSFIVGFYFENSSSRTEISQAG